MSRRSPRLLLGLLGFAAGGALLALRPPDEEPPPATQAATLTTATPASPARFAPKAARSPDLEARVPDEEATSAPVESGGLVVRVREADGRPASGAKVRLVGGPTMVPVTPLEQAAAGSLEEGNWLVADAHGVVFYSWADPTRRFAQARLGARSGKAMASVTPGRPREVVVVLDRVNVGGFAPRVVADESGEPLAGARVHVLDDVDRDERVVRAPRFEQSIGSLGVGPHQLLVTAPGRAPSLVDVEVTPGEVRPLELRLVRGVTIAGRVSGLDGGTLERVALVSKRDRRLLATTRAEGDAFRFEAAGVAGREAWLRIDVPGRFPHVVAVQPGEDLVVELPTTPVTVIELRDALDQRRESSLFTRVDDWVFLAAPGQRPDLLGLAVQGRLELRGPVPPGATVCTQRSADEPLTAGGTTCLYDKALLDVVPVDGVVVDAAGVPLAGVSVTCLLAKDEVEARTTADPQGCFRLALPVGPHTLAVVRAGLARIERVDVDVPHGGLRGVSLRLPAAVQVRVVAGPEVEYVWAARVVDGQDCAMAELRRDGHFELGFLPPGRWRIEGRTRGGDRVVEVDVTLPGPVEVRLP